MNPVTMVRESREHANPYTVPVFVEYPAGRPYSGTGTLLQFRECRFVLTCNHVIEPSLDDVVYFGGPARTVVLQTVKIHRDVYIDKSLDLAIYRMPDTYVPLNKKFYIASDICPVDVGREVLVYNHGYALGNSSVQAGIDLRGERSALYKSTTYLSETEDDFETNLVAKVRQRSIRWRQDEMLHFKTLERLPVSTSNPFVGQGFSGGPVFVHSTRRLTGYVTATDPNNATRLYYVHIRHALDFLQRHVPVPELSDA